MIHLPPEVIVMIANECGRELFALTLTSKLLHGICNTILYKNNAEYLGSYVIFNSMLSKEKEDIDLARLQHAKAAGVDFEKWKKVSFTSATSINQGARTATLLHTAAYVGFSGIVRFLVQIGFDIDAGINTDTGNDTHAVSDATPKTPLHLAILHSREEIANILIEKNASLCFGITNALNMAIRSTLPDLVKTLVHIRGMDINEADLLGYTPLIWAIISSTIIGESLVSLIVDLGADINKRSSNGMSPLMFACINKKYQLALDLLNSGGKIFYPISGINSQKLQQKAQVWWNDKQRFVTKALINMDASCGDPAISRNTLDVYCMDILISGLFSRSEDTGLISFLLSSGLPVPTSVWGGIETCIKMVSIGKIEWAKATYPSFLQALYAALPFISKSQRQEIPKSLTEFIDEMGRQDIPLIGRQVWTKLGAKFPMIGLPFNNDEFYSKYRPRGFQ